MSRIDRSRLPAVGRGRDFAFPRAASHVLPNGLTVRIVERRDLPVVTCMLLMPGGSALDPVDGPGLAALTADLLDESSGGRSALEVHAALDDIGAHCDVEIGCDATLIGLTTLSRFIEQGLGLMADMVARPGFREADVARVRELRLHRLLQLRDQPGAIADRAFIEIVFDHHPYGHLALGTEASLQRLTPRDVETFHRRRYVPSRATLIIVGDGSSQALTSHAARAFAAWSGDARDAADPAPEPPTVEPAGEGAARLFVTDRPGAAQSELRIGHLGVPRSTPDFHALLVLNAILGGQFVSRINSNLREDKGYTYGARSAFDCRRLGGSFVVQTSVASADTGAAIGEVLSELRDIRDARPPTQAELELARATLTRGFPRGFETTEQVARGLTQIVLHGLPDDYFTRHRPAIERVGLDDVRAAATARLEPDRLVCALVGDRRRIEPALGDLGLGEPVALAVD